MDSPRRMSHSIASPTDLPAAQAATAARPRRKRNATRQGRPKGVPVGQRAQQAQQKRQIDRLEKLVTKLEVKERIEQERIEANRPRVTKFILKRLMQALGTLMWRAAPVVASMWFSLELAAGATGPVGLAVSLSVVVGVTLVVLAVEGYCLLRDYQAAKKAAQALREASGVQAPPAPMTWRARLAEFWSFLWYRSLR